MGFFHYVDDLVEPDETYRVVARVTRWETGAVEDGRPVVRECSSANCGRATAIGTTGTGRRGVHERHGVGRRGGVDTAHRPFQSEGRGAARGGQRRLEHERRQRVRGPGLQEKDSSDLGGKTSAELRVRIHKDSCAFGTSVLNRKSVRSRSRAT